MKSFIFLFLLIVSSVSSYAINLQDVSPEFAAEIEKLENADPVAEEKKLVDQVEGINNIEIASAEIYAHDQRETYTLYPDQSLRVDYLDGQEVTMTVYVDNTFDFPDEFFRPNLYDVRISFKSVNDNLVDFTFRESRLSSSTFKEISLNPYTSLPRGSYPIKVTVTGRDINRQVHSDTQLFYINVGIDGNNSDIRYNELAEENERDELVRVIGGVVVIILIILLLLGLYAYNKLKKDEY